MMLTMWMGYALLFSLATAVIALATEHMLSIWRLPRRFVWIAALVATAIIPAGLALRRKPVARPAQSMNAARLIARGGQGYRVSPAAAPPLRRRLQVVARRVDPYARATWASASLIVLALFLRGLFGLARRRRVWREDELNGTRVLISPDAGPAVVGVLRPHIVVPEWALRLGATEVGLLLRHEREHVDARDPNALLFATLVLIVFPWNAVLWWMVHRLRLSVEIDCDARVLRAIDAPREYGLLLLAVGERRSLALPLSASLAERRTLLERRIHAMTTLRPRHPVLASLPFAAIALAATVAAAQTSPPAAAGGIMRARTGGEYVSTADKPSVSLEQARAIIAAHHPSVLAGNPDSTSIAVVLDANDHYVKSVVRVPAAASTAPAGSGGNYVITARGGAVSAGSGSSGGSGGSVGTARITQIGGSSSTGEISIQGLGPIPSNDVESMRTILYAAGEMGPNAVRVLVIKLK